MYHSLIQLLTAARLMDRAQGATISELSDGLGISKRSVYRVLETLDVLNYPYVKDEECGNRYRLMEGQRGSKWWLPLPSVSFDVEDRIVMDWLFESAARSPALSDHVRSLRKKLSFIGAATGMALEPKEGGAGPAGRASLLVEAPVLMKKLPPDASRFLDTLLEAATDRRACTVTYDSRESGVERTYDIHPLAVFEYEGGVYCFIRVAYYGSIRIIALERIRDLRANAERFDPPEGFDPESRLSDPFGLILDDPTEVRLRFSKAQAPYVSERAWPESYRLEDDPDGRLVMEFETGGIFGLKRWLLAWGRDVEVLEPAWLREEMAEELSATIELYRR